MTLGAPESRTLAGCQPDCNFAVVAPTSLPLGWRVGETTIRLEHPPGRPEGSDPSDFGQTPWSDANPCSVRTFLHGPGATLRMKQFLYDWAPPAAGVAPLWDSPWLEWFPTRTAIGWRGIDYREVPGACVQVADTQVELSTYEGSPDATVLEHVLRTLAPADPSGARRVTRVPFHARNYWIRHRERPYRVPYGLWVVPHRRPYDGAPSDAPPRMLLPPRGDLRPVSTVALADGEGAVEGEAILQRRGRPADRVWLIAMQRSDVAFAADPEPDERAAALRATRRVRRQRVSIAALDERVGAWEALWSEAGQAYGVWTSPSSYWSEARFLEFLASLEAT